MLLKLLKRCPKMLLVEVLIEQSMNPLDMSPLDREFIDESFPVGRQLILNREEKSPGLFWDIFWSLASHGHIQSSIREIEAIANDKSFRMQLDISKVPECCYFFRDPNAELTKLLLNGGGGRLLMREQMSAFSPWLPR
jgi:hypothetical protein